MSVSSDHEFNYMPSNWSKRYGPMELLARYFKFSQDITSQVRSSIEHERDVSYGPSEKTKYDVYGTNLPADAPIFLFIHGGYWLEFSKDMSGYVVPNLVAHGIKVLVAGYDLCPSVTLTDIVQQIKTLTEKVLALAHASGSKCVWIGGHSAGAHLAASLLHDAGWLDLMTRHGYRDLLQGLVLISGIYALEPLLRTSVNEAVKLTSNEINSFTFAPLEISDDVDKTLEPVRNVKVIVTVGECDSPIFIEESRRYARRLTKLVDNVEFLLLRDNVDHFDIVENLTRSEFLLSKILIANIKYTR
ncbi:kynurenine formamidase [Nasonia vitripennis]|uniref:Alpha/beta hydrolase fold-3 domain-containing protein n=1 Tax=Nasonia vitripennis TaxID=7425 RepID=A0A7M7GFA3_NASVI|nr:kynurenine formamidase [Nasonia vitripennis]